MASSKMNPKCFFDFHLDGQLLGRIVVELFVDIVPKTCENFMKLCQGTNQLGPTTNKIMTYRGCAVHRIKYGRIETGDFSNNDGTGGESIYGGKFEDENFDIEHGPYMLTMMNEGEPNSNGSKFAFSTRAEFELNGKNVAFGKILTGKFILDQLCKIPVDENFKPEADIVIMECGIMGSDKDKEEGELTTASTLTAGSTSNECMIIEEKEKKRERNPSIECIVETTATTRTAQQEDIPNFYGTPHPLRRGSPFKYNKQKKRRNADDMSPDIDVRKRRCFEHDNRLFSPEKDDNQNGNRRHPNRKENRKQRRQRSRNRSFPSAKKVKGRGTARYTPYSNHIPSPSYWTSETDRLIPMKEAEELINRKREETKAMFNNEALTEEERKNLFPIYNPIHDEAIKSILEKVEAAKKNPEMYYGYENSYKNLTLGPSTFPTATSSGYNFGISAPSTSSSTTTTSVAAAMENIHIQTPPFPPSPFQLNQVVMGVQNMHLQFPPAPFPLFQPRPPFQAPPTQQPHQPQFAYRQPRHFFF